MYICTNRKKLSKCKRTSFWAYVESVHINIYIYIFTSTCTYVQTEINKYIYICTRIYLYMCI